MKRLTRQIWRRENNEGSNMATEKELQLNTDIKQKGTCVLNSEREYNVIWRGLDITTKGVSSLVPTNAKL
jgi:hypothetical protein